MKRRSGLVRILVQVVDAVGVEQRGAPLDAVHLVALVEQELGQIGAVLAGDAGDPELGEEHRGLQGVQTAVDAELDVVVAPLLPVVAQPAQPRGERIVVGEAGPAVAVTAERLGRKEARTGESGQRTGAAPTLSRTETLRRVLDDGQPMAGGDGVDRGEIGALAEQAHRQDRARRGTDRGLEQRRIEIVGVRIDVDEDRPCAEQRDRLAGGDEGERRGDDLVARSHPERHQREQECVGSACDGDAVPRAGIRREPRLEFANLGAIDEPPAFQHCRDAAVDVGPEPLVLGLEVDEFHAALLPGSPARYAVPRGTTPHYTPAPALSAAHGGRSRRAGDRRASRRRPARSAPQRRG
jgi:hypothetical protein